MAFNLKRKTIAKVGKRLPSTESDDGDIEDIEPIDGGDGGDSDTESSTADGGTEDSFAPGFPLPSVIGKSNVVATQSWVYRILKMFWNWTRFFATQSIRVAGGLYAKFIKSDEIQSGDVYASRLILLDQRGKPAVIYIDEKGDLQREYKFEDVYIYGGGDVEIKSYFYRVPGDIMRNFIGLTPLETAMSFTEFQKEGDTVEFNEKTCPRLCEADGLDELVPETLLFKCPSTKKIVGLKVMDEDGELVKLLDFAPPEGKIVRQLTVNMPCFTPPEGETGETSHVVLPGEIMDGYGQFKPFIPPFLRPPFPVPPHFCPPVPPVVPPHVKPTVPPDLSPDIFDDVDIDEGDDLFGDITGGEETPNQPMRVDSTYQVAYEAYHTNTYSNVVLKRSDFDKNKRQFLAVVTEDA